MKVLILILYLVPMLIVELAIIALTCLLTFFFDKDRAIVHRVSRIMSGTISHLSILWKFKVVGGENLDRNRSYITVINHQNMLDIPVSYSIPLHFKWVSKKEVLKMPIFGWVLRLRGDIAIERGTASDTMRLFKKVGEVTSRGCSVFVFPEGTRNKGGTPGRFKDGAFIMAKENERPILPAAIKYEYKERDFFGRKVTVPCSITLRILEPIEVETVRAESVSDLREMAKARIVEALGR